VRAPVTHAPGMGPFHVKGVVFTAGREFYERRVPGGYAAVQRELGDAALVTFVNQTFLSGGWYDAAPAHAVTVAAARACGVPYAQLVREGAAAQAERDLHGIYKLIVSMASPEMVATRLPALSTRYFDFGEADGKLIEDRTLETFRWGIPMPFVEWFMHSVVGFAPVALTLAGAKNVHVRCGAPVREGESHGVPTARVRFEVSWE
jgi:hypothetical protein